MGDILGSLPSIETMVNYLNYGIIAFVAIFAIIGFFRGTYKSLVYLIATTLIIVGGWFLKDIISNSIINYDLSSFNINILEHTLTSPKAFITNLLLDNMPGLGGLLSQDTYVASLFNSLLIMIFRLVYFIILIVLNFSIFYFLTGLIWLIIKPRKRDSRGKKRKKSFVSRLGGLGIGFVKGSLYLLLLMFPLSGIFSIGDSLSQIALSNQNKNEYELVLLGDSLTLVASETQSNNPLGELGELLSIFGVYRKSVAGKVYGSIKISGTAIDEYAFDSLFNFSVGNEKIALRQELKIVTDAISKFEDLDELLDINEILSQDPELLKEFVDDISELKLLKVIIPMALEVAILYENEDGTTLLDQFAEGIEITLDDIHDADYSLDIKNLGYIFVDVTRLWDFTPGADNNLLASDPEIVKAISNNIGSLGIVDIAIPIGITYLMTLPEVEEAFAAYNVSMEDLGLGDIEDWGNEIAKFGTIYEAFYEFQIRDLKAFEDGADYNEILKYVNEENIDNFVEALFDSLIISKAVPVIMGVTLTNILPEDYVDMISFERVTWDATEFSALLNATVTLMKSGLIDLSSGETDFNNIDEAMINDLAKYLAKSKAITTNLNGIIETLFNNIDIFEDANFVFNLLEEEEWTEDELRAILNAGRVLALNSSALENFADLENDVIDDLALHLSSSKFMRINLNTLIEYLLSNVGDIFGDKEIEFITLAEEEWTKDELSSLFKAAKLLSSTDFNDFGEISDEDIDDLALYLSSSKFIRINLNPILDVFLADMDIFGDDIEFEKLDEDEWTKDELSHIFYAAKLLTTTDMDNIGQLDDEVIDKMSYHMGYSVFITRNLNPLIDKFLGEMDMGSMDFEFGTVDDWSDPVKSEIELQGIFKSAKIISNKGNSTDAFLDLSDEELDIFLSSELISKTLVNLIKSLSAEGNELDFLVGVEKETIEWFDGDFVDIIDFTIENDVLTFVPLENTNKYNLYANGVKVATTRSNSFDLTTIDLDLLLDTSVNWSVKGYNEGELRKIFIAVGALADSLSGDDSFSTDSITSLSDEEIDNILVSEILVLSIINFLEEEAETEDSFIIIPEGNLKSADEEVKLNAWKNTNVAGKTIEGELSKLFKGLRRFLDGNDIESFDMTTITSLDDEDIYEILKSEILSESIIVQIENQVDPEDPESIIVIPENMGLDNTNDRSAWLNVYLFDEGEYVYIDGKIQVLSDGELTKILRALKVILDGGDIDEIDIGNVLNKENQDIVLASLVMEESLIKKIENEANKEDAELTIPYVIKNDRSLWKGQNGELRSLLHALSYILGDDATIDDLSFDLDLVIEEKDEILRSLVISETIITKLDDQSEIHIPLASGYGLNDNKNREAWLNQYKKDSEGDYIYFEDKIQVLSRGELSRLLDAVDKLVAVDPITGERSLENIDFDISELFAEENRDIFLGSLVMSESIVHQVFEVAEDGDFLYIPSSLYLNQLDDPSEYNRDLWFNQYNIDGTIIYRGELDYLLSATKVVLGDDVAFSDLDFDISAAFEIENQKILLRSLVISETILHSIYEESNNPGSMLKIPSTEYVNDINSLNRDLWFNDYQNKDIKELGLVKEKELAYLLQATERLIDGEFSNLDFDISAAFDPEEQKIILRSTVIAETILNQVVEKAHEDNPSLYIAPSLYLDDVSSLYRTKWFNKYNDDGELVERNELANLLLALKVILGDDEFDNITEFDINVAFEETSQAILLRSFVISETIVQTIVKEADGGAFSLPTSAYLDIPHLTDERSRWYSVYDKNGAVLETNELVNLLNAASKLLAPGENFEGMDFKIENLFTEKDVILKSLIFQETIVKKIYEQDNNVINIPLNDLSGKDLLNKDDRSPWYNTYNGDTVSYYGEISHLLTAIEIILGPNGSFEEMDFDLNTLFERTKQDTILRSLVLSETIIEKIVNESDTVTNIPTFDLIGNPLNDKNDRLAWYNYYEIVDGSEVITRNEISKFLDAIKLIIGDKTFEDMGTIDIDNILEIHFTLTYDLNFNLLESDFAVLVNSVIMEAIIAPLIEDIARNIMEDFLVEPTGGYKFYKKDLIDDYNLATFDEAKYDLQGFMESLYVLNGADIDYKDLLNINILNLDRDTLETFAKAMVVSRVYKGSIEKMFNTILYPIFDDTLWPAIIITTDFPPTTYIKKDWVDVKFNQVDYNDESRVVTYNALISKLDSLQEMEEAVVYIPIEIPIAFYNKE